MKCTLFILLLCVQGTFAAFSQKISIKANHMPLEHVLELFREQSGYMVFYNTEVIKNVKKLDVNVQNQELKQALEAIFKDLPLTYEINDKTILIVPKKELLLKQHLVSSKVVNQNNRPLSGITVRVLRQPQNGVTTDMQGLFSIPVENLNVILQFTAIGYEKKEIMASSIGETVVLQESNTLLDDIVVTGYQGQLRRSITGSVVSVKGESIENMAVQSFDKAIQGRAAGVLIQSATGVPGGAVRVNIRGIGSINAGTDPMYIVDGIQLNSDETSSRTSTNAMAFINPNDIESIEILKDAAAAAVYGAQAANGVILITTKRGKVGRTSFSVNYYEGMSRQTKNMDVLSSQDAINLRMETLLNQDPNLNPNVALAQALTDFGVRPDMDEMEIAALPTYDWQKEAFKQGSVRNLEFSASGGQNKTSFYLSGAYNKHDGNVTNLDFERGTFRLRLNQEVNRIFSFESGVNLSMVTQNGNTGSWGSTTGAASPQYTASYMPPTVPIYNEDGSFNAYAGMPGTGFNPIQAATVDDNIVRQRALIGHASGSFNILEGLVFKSFYGLDYRFVRADYYRDPRTPNGAPWNGYLIDDNTENINFNTSQTFHYTKKIGVSHSITGLMGAEFRSDTREYESARANNFPTYQFRTNQSAAEPYSVTGSWSGSKRLGFFGQFTYDFENKFFMTAVARYDGSSRFGVNNRFGFFPGISAGYDLSKESVFNVGWLDQLKLRVGYGVVGNDQINNVSSRGFYQGGTRYNQEAALRLQTLANPLLGWERNASTNIGLDFGLLNNRVFGTLEVYKRLSHHLLLNKPLPLTSGFSNVDDNLGKVENKGLEIDLNTINVQNDHFTWKTNFNISFLRNEVLELYDGLENISNTIRVGHPLKIWYRPNYAGVNAANGRPMWYDKNGDITYLPTAEDNVPSKKGWMSDYFGGFNNTLRYKGFDLNALFHFDMGRNMANTMYTVWYNVMSNPGRNTLQELYDDRWTEPGQITYVARPIAGGAERNSAARQNGSSLFLHDASFIRLREVTLGYRFADSFLTKIKVNQARVYISAVNLYTWTKWIGYDPEFAVTGAVENNQGVVPQTMSMTAGFQVSF